MADFSLAIPTILTNEGGFVNDPTDPGGATKYGISLRFLQANGIDINHDGGVTKDDIVILTVPEASELYQKYFWKFDGIRSQAIATKIFDTCVNLGSVGGLRLCQRAARVRPVDGKYGSLTEGAFNGSNEGALLEEIRNRLISFYNNLAEARPEEAKNLNGWLKRAKQ
jgi:lysozyme family protein